MREAPETAEPQTPARHQRVALLLVAGLLLLVPLLTTNLSGLKIGSYPFTYDDIALPRLVLVCVALTAAWAASLWSSSRSGGGLRADIVFAALGALAVWALVSDAFSPQWALGILGQSERAEGLVMIAAYALLYGIALQVIRQRSDARLLATMLGIAATLSAVYGILQTARLDPAQYLVGAQGFSLDKAFATFANPNFLAGFLVLAIPVMLGLALTAADRTRALAWGIALAAVVLALLFTMTRGAWLAAVIEGFVFAVVFWNRRRRRIGARTIAVVVVAVLVISAIAAYSLFRHPELAGPADRIIISEVAISATAARPLVGYGPDAFIAAFRAHRSQAMAAKYGADFTMNNAHSWPLQFAATLGIPGALLLVFALGAAFWRARGYLGRGDSEGEPDFLMTGIYIGCLGFVLYMLSNVAVPGASAPFWVMLGTLGVLRARTVSLPKAAALAGAGVAAVACIAAIVLGGCLLAADHAYLQSRIAFRAGETRAALNFAEQAVRLNPLSIKYRRGLAQIDIDQSLAAISARASVADVRQRLAATESTLASARALDRADYPTLAWLAGIRAAVASYAKDPALAGQASDAAREAAALDVQHTEVAAIQGGDISSKAALTALAVPPLP